MVLLGEGVGIVWVSAGVQEMPEIDKHFLELIVVGELLEADTVGNEKLLHKIVNVVERDNIMLLIVSRIILRWKVVQKLSIDLDVLHCHSYSVHIIHELSKPQVILMNNVVMVDKRVHIWWKTLKNIICGSDVTIILKLFLIPMDIANITRKEPKSKQKRTRERIEYIRAKNYQAKSTKSTSVNLGQLTK
nr:hypothetical protein [Tanacetum cinerariifolium]